MNNQSLEHRLSNLIGKPWCCSFSIEIGHLIIEFSENGNGIVLNFDHLVLESCSITQSDVYYPKEDAGYHLLLTRIRSNLNYILENPNLSGIYEKCSFSSSVENNKINLFFTASKSITL